MKKSEIKQKFTEIVKFADIGSFIDAPFYTYSGGMKFRLAFSLAISSNCDTLILDEVFASGDIKFQNKSYKAIKDIQQQRSITTIVSSHIAAFIWAFSNSFIEINKGKVRKISKQKMGNIVKRQDKEWRNRTRINELKITNNK